MSTKEQRRERILDEFAEEVVQHVAPPDRYVAFAGVREWLAQQKLVVKDRMLENGESLVRREIRLSDRQRTAEEIAEREHAIEVKQRILAWEDNPAASEPPPETGTMPLLNQDTWWITKDRRVMRLVDMEASHRANLLAYLERHSDRLKFGYDMTFIRSMPEDPSDAVADSLDSIAGELFEQTAADWLNEFPMIKRLRELVEADG